MIDLGKEGDKNSHRDIRYSSFNLDMYEAHELFENKPREQRSCDIENDLETHLCIRSLVV